MVSHLKEGNILVNVFHIFPSLCIPDTLSSSTLHSKFYVHILKILLIIEIIDYRVSQSG